MSDDSTSSSSDARVEIYLQSVWERLLDLDEIIPGHDFFELGGNSMLMVKMLVEVRKYFGCELDFRIFLRSPDLSTLARLVEEQS